MARETLTTMPEPTNPENNEGNSLRPAPTHPRPESASISNGIPTSPESQKTADDIAAALAREFQQRRGGATTTFVPAHPIPTEKPAAPLVKRRTVVAGLGLGLLGALGFGASRLFRGNNDSPRPTPGVSGGASGIGNGGGETPTAGATTTATEPIRNVAGSPASTPTIELAPQIIPGNPDRPTATAYDPSPTSTLPRQEIPTNTATPIPTKEATPIPEVIRYTGNLSWEAKSLSPELGFDSLELNSSYPDAETAMKNLILKIHAQGEARYKIEPGQPVDFAKINQADPQDLETRMKKGNVTYKVPAHTLENWKEEKVPGYQEVRPEQGINFRFIEDKSLLDQRGHPIEGNAYQQETLQYRYAVDENGKLNIIVILDPAGRKDPYNVDFIGRVGNHYYTTRLPYGLDLLKDPNHMNGSARNLIAANAGRDMTYYDILGKPTPPGTPVDSKHIVLWDPAKGTVVTPLLI